MIKLRIIKILKDDIWGQFQAILISETQLQYELRVEGKNSQIVYLNTGETCTVDFMSLKHGVLLGDEIELEDYLISLYAKNPLRGMVIIVTKNARKVVLIA